MLNEHCVIGSSTHANSLYSNKYVRCTTLHANRKSDTHRLYIRDISGVYARVLMMLNKSHVSNYSDSFVMFRSNCMLSMSI